MKKTNIYKFLSLISLLGISSCSSTPSTKEYTKDTDPDYYDKITERVSFDDTNVTNFNESFKNGINGDVFSSVDGAWDAGSTEKHNGVRSRNLFYTVDEDGNKLLAIRGVGRYYEEFSATKNQPEGAVLITNNHLSPGRYEITMSSFPRFGGCTAFWTYCTTTGSEATSQNEIDIELGGGGQYTNQWCTTWTTHTNKQTKNVDCSDKLYFNDGKMHKYTFDWYTDYENSGEKRIDWFIDGQFITSISGDTVPEHEMQLWLGLWLPSWAGNSLFEVDYLLIKNVSFTAFDSSQFFDNCRSKTSFTTTNPDSLDIKTIDYSIVKNVNKLSNANFTKSYKYNESGNDYYGWNIDSASKGSIEFADEGSVSTSKAIKLTASSDTTSTYHGEYVYQTLGGAYTGFKYNLSIDAKLADLNSKGNIEIRYKDEGGSNLKKESISIDSTNWKTYTKELIMPTNSANLQIDITSEDGSVLYSNASLIFKK